MNIFKYNKGYTLLFSIIVSSVVLSIAAFILSVSRKQFILSSVVRDSTIAIYAADGGMQCAVGAYYEGYLATSTGKAIINCNGKDVVDSTGYTVLDSVSDSSMNLKNNDTSHKIYQSGPITLTMPGNTCARIVVTWGYDATTNSLKTIIDSRGYNFGSYYPCSGSNTINPRAIERGIRMQYSQ